MNGNLTEGRGIPGTWTRQEESQQIYLLGKGHAEALQMPELSKRHTVASESNLRGGLHAAHSLSEQQPRETAGTGTGRGKSAGFLGSPCCSVLHPDPARGTWEQVWGHGGTQRITKGTCPACKVSSGVIS